MLFIYTFLLFFLFFFITEHTQVTPGLPMLQSWYNNIFSLLHAFRCLNDRLV